jgi:hypothetical protein
LAEQTQHGYQATMYINSRCDIHHRLLLGPYSCTARPGFSRTDPTWRIVCIDLGGR